MKEFDNIIIGAGPGGYTLAHLLSSAGETVLVVEKDALGGTCLNRGCIPTKCLCSAAEAAISASRASQFGVDATVSGIDYTQTYRHITEVVAHLQEGIAQQLSGAKIVHGTAILQPERVVKVDGTEYRASKRLVIATGSKPASLPIPGAELAVTSDDILASDSLPESIIIIGGGVIGLEFASVYNALGVKVTVIEACKEILPNFDADIAKRLRQALSRRGVDICVATSVQSISVDDTGARIVSAVGKKGPVQYTASQVVIATGRRSILPSGIENIGVSITSRGFIEVDDRMQTSVADIYAIGDVTGLSMLAHSAEAQARVIASGCPEAFDKNLVPSVVFTHPELAQVGHTAEALKQQGIDFDVVRKQYASNGKACAKGQSDGIVKMLVDSQKRILSVTILGAHASDLIAEATILIKEKIPYPEIATRYIHPHPTLSELFI